MSNYNDLLNLYVVDLTKRLTKCQLADDSIDTLKESKDILTILTTTLNIIKLHHTTLENMIIDCQSIMEDQSDIEHHLTNTEQDDYVYQTKNGMLSYIGNTSMTQQNIDIRSELKFNTPVKAIKAKLSKQVHHDNVNKQEKVFIKELGYMCNMRIVNSLADITPMFFYCKGDPKASDGIYICLLPGVYIKMVYPKVIDSTKDYSRDNSIRCKHITTEKCLTYRRKIAEMYNNKAKQCTFAHEGEPLIKIGYPSRCPLIPRIGNPLTFANDIQIPDIESIKSIILYGLTDMFVAWIWMERNKVSNTIFDRIDTH